MDKDMLERLMMDQALGALPPDVEALLTAFLADRPQDQRSGERIALTVAAARRALVEPPSARLKAFPREEIDRRYRLRRRWEWAGRITGLAACILIGFGLHAAWNLRGAGSSPNPGSVGTLVDASAPSAHRPAQGAAAVDGFWSWKQVYERAHERRREPARRVIWDSPFSAPKLGEST